MSPSALRKAYLSRLLAERNQLWLGGIDPRAAAEGSERLHLSAVYTALLTENSEGAHFQAVSVLKRLWHAKKAVIGFRTTKPL